MCYDLDSRPPIAPIAGGAVDSQRLSLTSADGTSFAAFAADAAKPTGAGVIVLPDVRGLHTFYEELALRFAEAGVNSIAIDYFGRTAGAGSRGADFDFMPHVSECRYGQLVADITAARAALDDRHRDLRAVFTVGFCFGGRLAFLTATRPELELAGTIGFYGIPVGQGRAEMPAPDAVAPDMRVPLLGLFGGDDPAIPAASVEAFDDALTAAGVEHELVTYPGAPHSFFDRKADQFAGQSVDAWERVLEFVGRHTPPEPVAD
jgi:carboxymethylenebutenolidase